MRISKPPWPGLMSVSALGSRNDQSSGCGSTDDGEKTRNAKNKILTEASDRLIALGLAVLEPS